VLGFSEQTFYKWNVRPVCDRDFEEAHLLAAAYGDDPEFGHRFIADELQAAGHRLSERRVWRSCSRQRIFSAAVRRAKRNGKKPGPPVCDDLLQRDFTAGSINTTWLTDITVSPHRSGQALPVRDQGRLFWADRRLCHRPADEVPVGRGRPEGRGGPPRRGGCGGRVHRSQRPQ
jgi:hypothetical protein